MALRTSSLMPLHCARPRVEHLPPNPASIVPHPVRCRPELRTIFDVREILGMEGSVPLYLKTRSEFFHLVPG